MTPEIRDEWEALLARRRKHNASGQDGSDFAAWLQFREAPQLPLQLELFE
jgi:hypothetical protein